MNYSINTMQYRRLTPKGKNCKHKLSSLQAQHNEKNINWIFCSVFDDRKEILYMGEIRSLNDKVPRRTLITARKVLSGETIGTRIDAF